MGVNMFGDKLQKLRKDRKLSQANVADAIKISRSTYNNYEQNVSEPSFDTLKLIAKFFNVTIDYLLDFNLPYLLDKSTLSNEQIELLDQVIKLNRDECLQVKAFIQGLKSKK